MSMIRLFSDDDDDYYPWLTKDYVEGLESKVSSLDQKYRTEQHLNDTLREQIDKVKVLAKNFLHSKEMLDNAWQGSADMEKYWEDCYTVRLEDLLDAIEDL